MKISKFHTYSTENSESTFTVKFDDDSIFVDDTGKILLTFRTREY